MYVFISVSVPFFEAVNDKLLTDASLQPIVMGLKLKSQVWKQALVESC